MCRTIYFADRILRFTAEPAGAPFHEIRLSAAETLSQAKILNFLEIYDFVALVAPDFERRFAAFAAGFRPVEAAGGVVTDEDGRRLMIYRNGRWDLPKGHRETGESVATCALREVCEETGVAAAIRRPLCDTLHAYAGAAGWELKCTHWFEMTASRSAALSPQTEEGIECVCWCSPAEVEDHLQHSFPTIRRVFEAL